MRASQKLLREAYINGFRMGIGRDFWQLIYERFDSVDIKATTERFKSFFSRELQILGLGHLTNKDYRHIIGAIMFHFHTYDPDRLCEDLKNETRRLLLNMEVYKNWDDVFNDMAPDELMEWYKTAKKAKPYFGINTKVLRVIEELKHYMLFYKKVLVVDFFDDPMAAVVIR